MKPTLQDIRISTVLPAPKNTPLINKAYFKVPNIFTRKSKTYINAFNPFEVPVTMTHIKATMTVSGKTLGKIDEPVNFTIPPKQSVDSTLMTLDCSISFNSIGAIWNSLFKDMDVTVESEMFMNVGGYSTPLMYTQKVVSTKFVKSF